MHTGQLSNVIISNLFLSGQTGLKTEKCCMTIRGSPKHLLDRQTFLLLVADDSGLAMC